MVMSGRGLCLAWVKFCLVFVDFNEAEGVKGLRARESTERERERERVEGVQNRANPMPSLGLTLA